MGLIFSSVLGRQVEGVMARAFVFTSPISRRFTKCVGIYNVRYRGYTVVFGQGAIRFYFRLYGYKVVSCDDCRGTISTSSFQFAPYVGIVRKIYTSCGVVVDVQVLLF